MNIALKVYQRELPVSRGSLDDSVIEMAFIYLLMLLALVALSIPGPPKLLKGISGLGFVLSTLVKFWHHSFLNMFGWQYFGPGHLRPGPAWWILPWVMPALLAICFAKNLDS